MKRGALRVVAGTARGRRLDAPTGDATRPTSDRVREAIFNALESLGAIDGANALDAFAGSGALGIEALSRGAGHVTFVEPDPQAAAVVEANLAALELGPFTVLRTTVERAVGGAGPFSLVLLDPPYRYDGWPALLEALIGRLTDDAVVVIESDRAIDLPDGLAGIREKTYGGTVVQFASPAGAPS